ncbi:MAG: ROK family protein [Bacteroidota bacterium]
MLARNHIGIDLGGTNIRAGILEGNELKNILSARLNANGNAAEILQQVYAITDPLFDDSILSIGIGVPGLVDHQNALVYDVVNIPAWQKVPLIEWMEERYKVPVLVNNDANCFALGEYYTMENSGIDSMVGLTIGTGLGSGLILHKKLYTGRNGGAGEFGMIPYLDHNYEYYASGQFFENEFQCNGLAVFEDAKQGNAIALNRYEAFGTHLGNAIKTILFAVDVDRIVIGGSVKKAFPFFEKTMWQSLQTFPYQRALVHLKILVSKSDHSGILGAASLFKNFQTN